MKIAVIGLGYVGLTGAVSLAEAGHRVTGVERDPSRLDRLRGGTTPFYEPGLQDLLARTTTSGALAFVGSLGDLSDPPDAVLVTVGSPQLPSGGTDLRDLATAMGEVLALDPAPQLVVVKSTVPPGTSATLLADNPGLAGRYAFSPEFLSQGSALEGWRRPSRIVVGLEDDALLPLVRDLYRGVEGPWVVTNPTNAEMIKYASNAFLATKISFINEIANLCDDVGATVDEVVEGLGLDPRVGRSFLGAGIGYGGSCFPKDVQALTHLSSLRGRSMPLLQSVVAVNNAQRLRVVRAVRDHLRPGDEVAVLGLSFKPNTDDLREAPSLTVVPELLAQDLRVRAWDPVVGDERIREAFAGVEPATGPEQAAEDAAAVLVLTEWPQIVEADWEIVAKGMREPRLVLDGRNCLDPARLARLGLRYWGIGRGLRDPEER